MDAAVAIAGFTNRQFNSEFQTVSKRNGRKRKNDETKQTDPK